MAINGKYSALWEELAKVDVVGEAYQESGSAAEKDRALKDFLQNEPQLRGKNVRELIEIQNEMLTAAETQRGTLSGKDRQSFDAESAQVFRYLATLMKQAPPAPAPKEVKKEAVVERTEAFEAAIQSEQKLAQEKAERRAERRNRGPEEKTINPTPPEVVEVKRGLAKLREVVTNATQTIRDAANNATAKIDQRVAAAAEKKEIKQAVKEWEGKPSLFERIKNAATNAKTKISGIANNAIAKIKEIGKKAESQAVEMDEMKVSAPDVSTFKKVTENNAAQLAANTVLNPHQGANAEEVQAPPKEVEKGQEKVAEYAEAKAAVADPEVAQDLASVEAVEVQANNDIQKVEQGFTMQMDVSYLDYLEATTAPVHEPEKPAAKEQAEAGPLDDWSKQFEADLNEAFPPAAQDNKPAAPAADAAKTAEPLSPRSHGK